MNKDPDETLDYAIDWSAELADKGDTAQAATWTVPDGISRQSDTLDGGKAVIWLTGGTEGVVYQLGCRLTTAGGRTYDRTLTISVEHR